MLEIGFIIVWLYELDPGLCFYKPEFGSGKNQDLKVETVESKD